MMLSKYQKYILSELDKDGTYIFTNEGKNYSCWLQYKCGTKKPIRKDTVGKLFEMCYITSVEGVSNTYFTYGKTNKKVS